MNLLPPEGPDALATRADVGRLDGRMDEVVDRIDRLDDRMDGLEVRMDRLDVRMDGLDDRMGRLEASMEKFDGRLHDFHGALREQTRSYILASTTSSAVVATVAFTAAALI